MVYHAFRTAFQYRTPVEIMTEGRLGQMMEDIELPPMVDNSEYQVPDWAYDGTTKIYDYNWGPHDEQHRARQKSMEDVLQEWELFHVDEKTETVIVTLGLPSRITKGAILEMEGAGEKIGMLRIKTAWPFPIKAFKALPDSVKRLIVVETSPLNSGLADDVLITAKKIPALRDIPVFVNNTQVLITRQELIDYVKQAKSGMIKEVG